METANTRLAIFFPVFSVFCSCSTVFSDEDDGQDEGYHDHGDVRRGGGYGDYDYDDNSDDDDHGYDEGYPEPDNDVEAGGLDADSDGGGGQRVREDHFYIDPRDDGTLTRCFKAVIHR